VFFIVVLALLAEKIFTVAVERTWISTYLPVLV